MLEFVSLKRKTGNIKVNSQEIFWKRQLLQSSRSVFKSRRQLGWFPSRITSWAYSILDSSSCQRRAWRSKDSIFLPEPPPVCLTFSSSGKSLAVGYACAVAGTEGSGRAWGMGKSWSHLRSRLLAGKRDCLRSSLELSVRSLQLLISFGTSEDYLAAPPTPEPSWKRWGLSYRHAQE